jgi:Zn-finger nucleic acid-binding protein
MERWRVLVACPACQLQFDASGRPPGAIFRCLCGHALRVPAPRAHDAAVVRCSSCGGPREAAASACRFCGSDFTLHEQDLHTICPGCMARVSDRGRFCHHCGLPILPSAFAGEATDRPCPACGAEWRLVSRNLGGGGITVLECGGCGGLWLGNPVFVLLEERARREGRRAALEGLRLPSPDRATSAVEPPVYRPCPECGRLMHRRNYGRKSGVILDVCGDHGLWFDRGELDRVLRWIRRGELERSERLAEEESRHAARAAARERAAELEFASGGSLSSPVETGGVLWMAGAATDFVGWLIGWVGDRLHR